MKYILISLLIISQLAGFFFLVQQQFVTAIICFILNGLALVLLLITLIRDRVKEKKEEEDNDYRDY
ncbi:hypothetical protein [Bacillus sp. AK128]